MLKITCACLFLCCLSIHAVGARPPVKRDSLLTILHISNPQARERQLILFLRYYFEDVPKNRLDATKAETNLLMQRYDVTDRIGIGYFIETLSLMQLRRYREAERALIQAIALADKNDDSYLLYACFTHLGFIQTYYGNMIEATSSFRMAKKQAGLLEDAYMQVIIDINISDIYYRINLYSQALFYIDQARSLMISHHITEPKIKNAINNNKAEIYFHMGNIDSLKKYNQVLTATGLGPTDYIVIKNALTIMSISCNTIIPARSRVFSSCVKIVPIGLTILMNKTWLMLILWRACLIRPG